MAASPQWKTDESPHGVCKKKKGGFTDPMKPRLNYLASFISLMSGGNPAPLITCPVPSRRWVLLRVFVGVFQWQLLGDEGELKGALHREIHNKDLVRSTQDLSLGRRFTFQQDSDHIHTAKQCRSSLAMTLWMSFGGSARALTWTHSQSPLERPENGSPSTVPTQPEEAWKDVQRRMAENPQIQVCKACRVIPKKTRCCNRCQWCFN